ncbi:MAG: NAD-dependent epimerase/dehydratase family protein [Elusimicrobia bacterium]|nr:NAD-dependent epimerase/dehydratase family protein [Elusimicrobiota bacterium]
MRTLVIGGSRFVGWHIADRLLRSGHDVTLLRRGSAPSPFPGAKEVLGERADSATWARLPAADWDLAVDCCAYSAEDTRTALKALEGRVGRYVNIGTGQVYLVLEGCPRPTREADYSRPLMARPAGPEGGAWDYGVGKRACEDALAEAGARGFPFTTLRLPVMQGPRDRRRLHAYVKRLLAGEPLVIPRESEKGLRHLYAPDAAALVESLAGTKAGLGKAYNLAMLEDDVTLPELLKELCRALGRPADVRELDEAAFAAEGPAEEVSPLSGSWISFLDPSAAVRDLGFKTTPWRTWLAETALWAASDLRS